MPNLLDELDRDLLVTFLCLIRDKYPEADEASHYLESRGLSGISVTVTNQRDALSHLVTFLQITDREEQEAQLHHAQEHLRRAIIEPYQIVATAGKRALAEEINLYRREVLTLDTAARTLVLEAPTEEDLKEEETAIRRLIWEGRQAKAENRWTAKWEQGIQAFVAAEEKAEALRVQLRQYRDHAAYIRKYRAERSFHIRLGVIMLLLGLIGAVLIEHVLWPLVQHRWLAP